MISERYLWTIFLIFPVFCVAQRETAPIDYVESQPLKKVGMDASASISTPLKIERGKSVPITITFRNNGSAESFYNVTFNGLLPTPAGLILFDASNQYIVDLFSDERGWVSRRSIQS